MKEDPIMIPKVSNKISHQHQCPPYFLPSYSRVILEPIATPIPNDNPDIKYIGKYPIIHPINKPKIPPIIGQIQLIRICFILFLSICTSIKIDNNILIKNNFKNDNIFDFKTIKFHRYIFYHL